MHKKVLLVAAATALMLSETASAVPVLCQAVTNNHMLVDDSQVTACLDAGEGNLTGNPANDLFLNGVGAAYTPAGKSDESGNNPFNLQFTQAGDSGTWSFDDSFWNTHSDGAIGFKFGTGDQPDEWFVYSLVTGVFSGNWDFVNVFETGGGLSHIDLYGIPTAISEPTTLALFGLGLMALAFARRRKWIDP